jgi:hypothetical protein
MLFEKENKLAVKLAWKYRVVRFDLTETYGKPVSVRSNDNYLK